MQIIYVCAKIISMSLYLFKTNTLVASIKDADATKGIVTGYFASFNNVDSDGDIIRKGAFVKSIMETGPKSTRPRIKHLQNHNTSQPLGKLEELKEDEMGLYYESQVGTHTLGVDFIKMVESGLITEHSIGYRTMKRNQLQDYDGFIKNPAGGWFELTELQLWEGSSLTAWGANYNTPITGMKGKEKEDALQKLLNRQKSIETFCRSTTASDETIELLLLEGKQLTQIILDLNKSTQPADATEPVLMPFKDFGGALSSFTKSLKTTN